MTNKKIFEEVVAIFKSILKKNDLELNLSSKSTDIDGWDSWAHINIIVSIEQKFRIKFSADEVTSLSNVGMLVDLIMEKTH